MVKMRYIGVAITACVIIFSEWGAKAGESGGEKNMTCASVGKIGLAVEKSLEINAPAAEVWDTALDVKTWPQWVPSIKSTSFEGDELAPGSQFKLTIKVKGLSLPFKLTVCEYEKHRRIAWSAGSRLAGYRVVRALIFEENNGVTRVTSREQFSGPAAKFIARMINREDLAKIHADWLAAIKQRTEQNKK